MAQKLARDEQGNIWDVSDPASPRFVSRGQQSLLPNPTLPGQLQGQSLGNTGKSIENTKNSATLPYDIDKAKADAKTAQIAANVAQEQWNINHPSQSGAEGMSGPAYMHYLQQTDPGRAAYIQGLAEGRVPFPSATMMRTPAGQALLTQVMRADPTIDATNYTTRAAARKNAATGTLSKEDNALITAVGHAAELRSLVPDVYGTKVAPFNSLANYLEGHFFGGDQPTYDMTAKRVGAESAAAYGEGTGGERELNAEDFSSTLATPQKYKNIDQDIRLLASKLAANRAQFAYGNGQLAKPDFMLLPPQTQKQLLQIAPEVAKEYFSGIPVMGQNGAPPGGNPPPNGPSGPGFSPPPTGSTNGGPLTPSDQFNTTPDPQSAQFWSDAAHNQVPYRTALAQWQSDVQQRGLVGQTPPPPEAYNRAATYIQRHPNIPYQPFSSVTKTPIAPVQQDVQNAANGAVFSGPGVAVGHALNAATANVPTLLAGDNGARYNAISSGLHGNYALGGDIAGTVAGSVGAGFGVKAAAPSLGRIGSFLTANPARTALTGDSLFLGGSGAAQNPDNPVGGAALGLVSALTGNALGRYAIGPAARALLDTNPVQKGVNAVGGMFGRSFNPPAAIDPGQSMILKRANDLDAIRANLTDAANLNLPYTLADANPKLRALAGSAARKSPDVLTTAENVLGPRQQGQAERAIAQLNNLAPVGDVPTLQKNILNTAQTQSAPLYADAKAQPTPDLIANPALQDVLNRPAAQTAIRNGYNTALNNGEDVGTLSFGTDANDNPVQFGNPSWNVIHYTRQALDNAGETSTRQALDKQISALNPGFKAADAKYAGVMKGSDALQAGSDASAIRVTPEAAQNAMDAFAKSNNLPLFQQGYTSNLADMIERQRLSGNPYNLVNGSLGQQSKLASVFPQGAPNFLRAQGLEGDMGKTYQEALGGSQTAARTAADKAFDNAEMATDIAMAPATHGASLAGLLMTGARKGLGYLGDRANIGINTAKANAMAPYLFNPDPAANLDLLNQINLQAAQRRAYLQNFGAVTGNVGAGMFGAPIVYGASQN